MLKAKQGGSAMMNAESWVVCLEYDQDRQFLSRTNGFAPMRICWTPRGLTKISLSNFKYDNISFKFLH